MPRFDVYRLDGRNARYVVDVQSDFLSDFSTRVAAPLFPQNSLAPVAQLNPVFEIECQKRALFTQLLATLPNSDLNRPIATLTMHRDEITCALDLLLTGI